MDKTRLISAIILTLSLGLIIGGAALMIFTPAARDAVLPTQAALPDEPSTTADDNASRAGAALPVNLPPTTVPPIPESELRPQSEPKRVTVPQGAVPAQVVISFDPQASAEARAAYLNSLGGTVHQEMAALNTVIVNLPAEAPLPSSPLVAASEPNYYVTAQDDSMTSAPNDPRFTEQWALPLIGAAEAWPRLPADTPAVTVAVIDSGICQHPELDGRVLAGYDFVENDDTPQDEFGHGCAIAGILAASINDDLGMAGAAPNIRVMPLRVLNSAGIGTYASTAAAITYAVDHGADIINLSLGGSSQSAVLRAAVDYADQHGVMVIAAAGNNGSPNVLYPAAYDSVIAVGAVDRNLQRSSFSNYGAGIDLWGPGRDILATGTDGGYRLMSGTSFAAPYVAGVAALERGLGGSLNVSGGIVSVGGLPITRPTDTPSPDGTSTPEPTAPPAGTNALFAETDAQGALGMDTRLGVIRSRYTAINFSAISQTGAAQVSPQSAVEAPLTLNLFDDVTLTAIFDSVEAHELTANGFVWRGYVDGQSEGSEVILVVGDGQMAGQVRTHGELYYIAYAGGVHAINQLDERVFDERHINPFVPDIGLPAVEDSPPPPEASANSFTQIDLMVVYTANARGIFGGTSATQNAIQLAVAAVNQAYINSGVNARQRLVYTGEVNYDENTGDWFIIEDEEVYLDGEGEDLYHLQNPNDGHMDNVHTLRNTHNADVVTLLTNNNAVYCGVGYQMSGAGQPHNNFGAWAFNVVIADCLPGGRTLAHEIGHNMGAAHNYEGRAGNTGLHADSYGYWSPDGAFRTIMSYTNYCPVATPCVSINYFSDNTRTFGGRPLGNSNANNVATLNQTAPVVSGFRGAPVVGVEPTPTPIGLTPTPTPVQMYTPSPTPIPACYLSVAYGDTTGLINAINTFITASPGGNNAICLAPNGVYDFDSGTFTYDSNGANALPAITSQVRIAGQGATLRRTGTGEYRFFYVQTGGSLSLYDLTLENGRAPFSAEGGRSGGAVYVRSGGSLFTSAVNLYRNIAYDFGGAVFSLGGQVAMHYGLFTGNSAYGGGVVYSTSGLHVTRSVVIENIADYGSFLYANSPSVIPYVAENCIVGNSQVSIYNYRSSPPLVNARNNWWGSSRGPTLTYGSPTPDRGDLVGEYVDYEPYHTRALSACTTLAEAPALIAPVNNAATSNNSPTFSWTAVADATHYEFQLAADSAFNTIAREFSPFVPEQTIASVDDGTYYWRVRGVHGEVYGAWSEVFTLTIDTVPPAAPTLITPDDSSEVSDQPLTFSWSAVDGATLYHLRLTRNTPADYYSLGSSFTLPTPIVDGSYTWQVRAQDAAGNWSAWSDEFAFDLFSNPDAAPGLNRYATSTVTLRWGQVTWATAYHIQIDDHADFSSPLVNDNTLSAESQSFVTSPLAEGRYHWRIRARRANGNWSAWSVPAEFWVDIP